MMTREKEKKPMVSIDMLATAIRKIIKHGPVTVILDDASEVTVTTPSIN
jgi:hypothetical protein